ncbi:glycoside hydrolase family 13 protein [Rickenella mellea]|uniref:Glycoside hydrolase family 13 protein n=1 Tax=Rickenella mellea TaxID=50990 RepID=A0A4Y7PIR5_9AGAM|nr:glycoside hydrolase family 13 protein [Rickenella mellea]
MPPPSASPFTAKRAWWKESTIYQIYPSSFCDSNGDGIGDLPGILSKLDYLKGLGVDIVWLSPIYKSPWRDGGYDISDYRDIDPRYGTLDDWDMLVKGLHERGMKIMMDLVVNHTSDEHEWFRASRSSKSSSKRDWYIWRPARYDPDGTRRPPNNWKSIFEGSAWTWDSETQEYYLHLFLPGQPDLNWENPDVREAIFEMMRFWLDRGTDGFRMDVINLISKVPGFPDAPICSPNEEYQLSPIYWANGPRVHEFVKEMNRKVLSKYECITVGEAPFTDDMEVLAAYVLPINEELNMVFHFELMQLDIPPDINGPPLVPRKWKLTELKDVVEKWQNFMREEGYWNSVYIDNHDQPRSVSRFGDDSPAWRARSAKMLAILHITQSGTLFVYQGQEIGMANVPRSWGIEEYKDVQTQNFWDEAMKPRPQNGDTSDLMDGIQKKARDNSRTPMQWNGTANAGFTSGTPWMRVNDDYTEWNLQSQINDPESVWSFWHEALQFRKEHDVFIYGNFEIVDASNEKTFAFIRCLGDIAALIVLNFTDQSCQFTMDDERLRGARLVLSNYDRRGGPAFDGSVGLQGYEGVVYVM